MDLITAQTDLALARRDRAARRPARRAHPRAARAVARTARARRGVTSIFPMKTSTPTRATRCCASSTRRARRSTRCSPRRSAARCCARACARSSTARRMSANRRCSISCSATSARSSARNPGTTRDVIEEVINLRGIPLRLIDTAGVRESEDEIERAGMERTRQQVERADLVLQVVDASGPTRKPERGSEGERADLARAEQDRPRRTRELARGRRRAPLLLTPGARASPMPSWRA